MKKKIDRKSFSLRWLKNDLRNEAIREEDGELEKKLWRWYYRAKDAEYEVDILMGQSDVRDILKAAIAKGLLDEELSDLNLEVDDEGEDDDSESPPSKESKRKSRKKPPDDDDDLPKQKGFWDETP